MSASSLSDTFMELVNMGVLSLCVSVNGGGVRGGRGGCMSHVRLGTSGLSWVSFFKGL